MIFRGGRLCPTGTLTTAHTSIPCQDFTLTSTLQSTAPVWNVPFTFKSIFRLYWKEVTIGSTPRMAMWGALRTSETIITDGNYLKKKNKHLKSLEIVLRAYRKWRNICSIKSTKSWWEQWVCGPWAPSPLRLSLREAPLGIGLPKRWGSRSLHLPVKGSGVSLEGAGYQPTFSWKGSIPGEGAWEIRFPSSIQPPLRGEKLYTICARPVLGT